MPAPILTGAIECYHDPAVYDLERKCIFAKTWQFIGLLAGLTRTGDFLADILVGYLVVVVRDTAGVLHGFHNVCRHRDGPLPTTVLLDRWLTVASAHER